MSVMTADNTESPWFDLTTMYCRFIIQYKISDDEDVSL